MSRERAYKGTQCEGQVRWRQLLGDMVAEELSRAMRDGGNEKMGMLWNDM